MFRFFRGILLFGPVFALGGCQPRDTSPTVEEDTSDSVPIVDADSDGYTEDDCDDGNADVHPGATEPRCENDIDDDCDGEVDEFPLGGRCLEDVASTSIQELTDGHGDGGGLSIGGDIDGDGRSDLLFSGGGGISPPGAGHVHLFLAANLGTGEVSTAAADWTLVGDTLSYAGSGISGYSGDGAVFLPDLDGDGRSEVLVGAPGADDGVGAAYLVFAYAFPEMTAEESLTDFAWSTLRDATGATSGLGPVAPAGDVDGDGQGDIVLAGSTDAWVVRGLTVNTTDLNAGAHIQAPDEDFAYFGESVVGAGDLDGDGLADVGVSCIDCGPKRTGEVFLFRGSSVRSEVTLAAEDADGVIAAAGVRLFGTAVTGGEDVDGDGLGDLVACSLETAGGVFLFTGGTALTTTTEAAASIHLTDDEDGGYGMFGQSVAFGEVDGDGAVDLMVADNDPRANFYAFPNAVLRAGGVTGSEAASRFYQPRDTYEFGAGKLRMGGDLDADGMEELVIAYPSWGPYGEPAGYGAAVVVGGADLRAE